VSVDESELYRFDFDRVHRLRSETPRVRRSMMPNVLQPGGNRNRVTALPAI
jgi:hypothetical protein